MDNVTVLQNFSKHKALLVVVLGATVLGIHIADTRKARVGAGCRIDGNEGVPYPVAILQTIRIS